MIGQCSLHWIVRICSSHCDIRKCLTNEWTENHELKLKWKGYVHQIMTTRLCSSHCNVKIFSTHFHVTMFVTSRHPFFHHIAMKGICPSHHNVCICLSHYEITMFAMLGLCSSPYDDRDMFITLQWQGYHHHITMRLFC